MTGGTADEGLIDAREGAKSLEGFSRAMVLMANSYVTTHARKRTFSIAGVKLFREASRRGSFVDAIRLDFDENFISDGQAQQFFQLVEWCLNEAIGVDVPDLSGPIFTRMRDSADELVACVQEPIRLMHRPISRDSRIVLTVQRVQGETLAQFDRFSALRFVEVVAPEISQITGDITRFNSLSKWGRIYSDVDGRTVSFRLRKDMPQLRRSRVTRSLHRFDRGEPSKIKLYARAVTVTGGRVKRYLVEDVDPID
jgi:hypothetical protein